MNKRVKRNILMNLYFIITGICVMAIDQVTKYLIIQKLPINKSIEIIKGFFYITHINNTGAAFGLFQGYTRVLAVVSIIAILLIVLLKTILRINSIFYNISLGFILGGALGNLVDRYFAGKVTDFFNFTFFGAVFNVADLFINVGFFLTIVIILKEYFVKKSLRGVE
jgi:signal peptidase II